MGHLTAAQNIYLGREPRKLGGLFLDEEQLNRNAQALFDRMRLVLSPATPIGELTVARQQMVEIAKALSKEALFGRLDNATICMRPNPCCPACAGTARSPTLTVNVDPTIRPRGAANLSARITEPVSTSSARNSSPGPPSSDPSSVALPSGESSTLSGMPSLSVSTLVLLVPSESSTRSTR